MEKMSITRALAEVKLLDKRIEKTIGQSKFVTYAKSNCDNVSSNVTKEDYNKSAKASLQSIKDLIERKSRIQSAIAVSNATEQIEVAKAKYSVAEAIYRKNSIDNEKLLLKHLRHQLTDAKDNVEYRNEEVNNKLQNILITMVGKDNVKSTSVEANSMSKQYLADNEFSLVDGLGAEKVIEDMEKEIDEFLFEIDFSLSTHNSLTEIEI